MYTPWGTKGSRRLKHGTRKTKVHWKVLGLQDPTATASTPSIEDIRREIISASSHGLSRETLARAQTKKGASRQSVPKTAITNPKQKVRS
jgi:hypothetical protein